MVPSSALCRAQESLHRSKAADTALENVRRVATDAAEAWAKEAIAAERREERQVKVRAAADGDAADEDAMASENPDRGLAEDRVLS